MLAYRGERDPRKDKSGGNEVGGRQVSCSDTFIMERGCLGVNLAQSICGRMTFPPGPSSNLPQPCACLFPGRGD